MDQHLRRIIVDAQEEWHFWTALYPLFKQALPDINRLSEDERRDPTVKNAISNIRQNIRQIPLEIQQPQLNEYLQPGDYESFLQALLSLLDIFECHVEDEVRQLARDPRPSGVPMPEKLLRSRYPKLAVLKSLLQNSESNAGFELRQGEDWHIAQYSTDFLLEQARHIKFHGLRMSEYHSIAEETRHFNSIVGDLFHASLGASDGDLGNAALLRVDEIEFIRRAHHLNLSSSSLFILLAKSITCRKAHTARIHLSGFLDPEFNFGLYVAACAEQYWQFTNCRWVVQQPQEINPAGHDFCSQAEQMNAVPRAFHLAFDDKSIWDDAGHKIPNESTPVPSVPSSLCKLIFPGSGGTRKSELEKYEFEPEDLKIVELLLACSLLHLNTSHWLQAGWDIERILIYPEPRALDPFKRWKPHISCSLESSPNDQHESHHSRSDNDLDIVSFGLLIMEMEVKEKAEPTENDTDWETRVPSKGSILDRVLTRDWKKKLDDGYKQIGMACLRFRELAEKFYDPNLRGDMKRTAAIYKYILAPLYQLVSQRYSSASLRSKAFPDPFKSSSAAYTCRSGPSRGSGLVLFDDSSWHDPQKVSWASEFRRDIEPFVDKIRFLEDSCEPIPDWAIWRQERVRIAIIDTGIDSDDVMIESGRECHRIKDCRGFVNDPSDYKDCYGHGTHVARLLLDIAPSAELYIAKVSDGRNIDATDLNCIAEAVKWAQEVCKAHLITMSFGVEPYNRNVDISKAIFNAFNHNVTMFAAAANNGGNKPRAYPSNQNNRVICVHASDGKGNKGGISPSPEEQKDNFTTLGISIESKWKGSKVQISGTSFATPIAVALAANVLEFARYNCKLDDYEQQCLYRFDGVSEILRLMSTKRDRYDYITPLHLWDGKNTDSQIAEKIREIARSC